MSWDEFCTYLSGLNEKTSLGKIVAIRSEKDPKVIKEMTAEQKRIRDEWQKKDLSNKTEEYQRELVRRETNNFLKQI